MLQRVATSRLAGVWLIAAEEHNGKGASVADMSMPNAGSINGVNGGIVAVLCGKLIVEENWRLCVIRIKWCTERWEGKNAHRHEGKECLSEAHIGWARRGVAVERERRWSKKDWWFKENVDETAERWNELGAC